MHFYVHHISSLCFPIVLVTFSSLKCNTHKSKEDILFWLTVYRRLIHSQLVPKEGCMVGGHGRRERTHAMERNHEAERDQGRKEEDRPFQAMPLLTSSSDQASPPKSQLAMNSWSGDKSAHECPALMTQWPHKISHEALQGHLDVRHEIHWWTSWLISSLGGTASMSTLVILLSLLPAFFFLLELALDAQKQVRCDMGSVKARPAHWD